MLAVTKYDIRRHARDAASTLPLVCPAFLPTRDLLLKFPFFLLRKEGLGEGRTRVVSWDARRIRHERDAVR